MKIINICILFLLCWQPGLAQNLVPDSSFEMNKFVPMDFSELSASQYWSIPSQGTSDLFCKCSRRVKEFTGKAYSQVDVPQNPMGDQYPHSGTCYAGIFAYSHGSYREYLQTPLSEPLQKNKTYLFTMYISLADYSCASVDQLGVCFLFDKAAYHSSTIITDLKPVYVNIEREIENDIKDWHRVTLTYRAHGGERYLLFGSFKINKVSKTKIKAPKEVKTRINQHTERDAYYFADDISLVETYPDEQADTITDAEQEAVDQIPADTLLTLKNVLFESNEILLLQASCAELDVLVNYLKQHMQTRIEIFGHTDNSGKEANNKKLSTGRAKAVATYLTVHGIAKARINYTGYGSLKPIAGNDTDEGKQQNRRVEFQLIN